MGIIRHGLRGMREKRNRKMSKSLKDRIFNIDLSQLLLRIGWWFFIIIGLITIAGWIKGLDVAIWAANYVRGIL